MKFWKLDINDLFFYRDDFAQCPPLPPYPLAVEGAVGVVRNKRLRICGGRQSGRKDIYKIIALFTTSSRGLFI